MLYDLTSKTFYVWPHPKHCCTCFAKCFTRGCT